MSEPLARRCNLGNEALAQGDYAGAVVHYKQCINEDAANPQYLLNLGVAFHQMGRLHQAQLAYTRSLELHPDNATALINLGLTQQQQDRLPEAIAAYRYALRLEPDNARIHLQLGTALCETKNLRQSIHHYREATRLDPDNSDAACDMALALLLANRYAIGWRFYQTNLRKEADHYAARLCLDTPWSERVIGLQPKHLNLVSLLGYGDTLHFMRYLPVLAGMGYTTSLCAQNSLHGLIRSSGIDPNPISPEQAQHRMHGPWAPLHALPGLLGVRPNRPICDRPYIKCESQRISHWKAKLSVDARPLIAITWQGNPAHETTNFRGRSLPLELFNSITACTEGTLVSLQKGSGSEQLEACSFRNRFASCQSEINQNTCFSDSAAILANCDLVISSDTALVHLAAGMGKPTWLLLKDVPEWRWGLHGSQSFWYPSLRLFRQTKRGDWQSVIEEVCAALKSVDRQSTAWSQA